MFHVANGKWLRLVALGSALMLLVGAIGACASDDDDDDVAQSQQQTGGSGAAAQAATTGSTTTDSGTSASTVAQAQFEAYPEDGMPMYGGTLRISNVTPDHLSSLHLGSGRTVSTVLLPMYPTLTRWDWWTMYGGGEQQLGPGIADSWEIDQGAGIYTFNLRDDVSWWDGAPLTCTDVKATFEFYLGNL